MKLFPGKPGNFFPNATKKIFSHIDGISQQEFDMVNLRQNPGKPSLLKGATHRVGDSVQHHPTIGSCMDTEQLPKNPLSSLSLKGGEAT